MRLINEIVAFVCNTMVTENAVAYVTVSQSDANAQKLVSKAVQVLNLATNLNCPLLWSKHASHAQTSSAASLSVAVELLLPQCSCQLGCSQHRIRTVSRC